MDDTKRDPADRKTWLSGRVHETEMVSEYNVLDYPGVGISDSRYEIDLVVMKR